VEKGDANISPVSAGLIGGVAGLAIGAAATAAFKELSQPDDDVEE